MTKQKVHVRSYKRFKNGKWESVKDYEKEIDAVKLNKKIVNDIRSGKSVNLITDDDDRFYLETPKEFKDLKMLISNNGTLYIAENDSYHKKLTGSWDLLTDEEKRESVKLYRG